MAQEAPIFEAAASQWPEGKSLPGHAEPASMTPSPPRAPRDRRLLWGAIGLASMALAIGVAAFARKQGWLD